MQKLTRGSVLAIWDLLSDETKTNCIKEADIARKEIVDEIKEKVDFSGLKSMVGEMKKILEESRAN